MKSKAQNFGKILVRFTNLLLLGAALTFTQANAQAQDAATINAVYTNLKWSSGDHGFNEGAQCGANALGGGLVQLPIPFPGQVLGNIWDRTNMMGAAVGAYRAGYVDAAINAAICSQIHNQGVYALLSANRGIVGNWLASH
jgi:hypothetical protein